MSVPTLPTHLWRTLQRAASTIVSTLGGTNARDRNRSDLYSELGRLEFHVFPLTECPLLR